MDEQTQPQTQTPEQIQSDVDAALKNDPQRQLSERVAADLAEAGVADPSKAPEASTPVSDAEYNETKERVSRALAQREKTWKEREALKAEADSLKTEAMRFRAEAEQSMREVQRQMAQIGAWKQALKSNPAEAIKAVGLDPEEFIFGLANDGTPEAKLRRELAEQSAKLREFERWQSERTKAEQEARERAQIQEQQRYRSHIETEFVGKANSDRYSNIKIAMDAGILSKKSLLQEGDDIADRYRDATGQEAELEEILEYIDTQLSSAIGKLSNRQNNGTPRAQAQPKQISQSLSSDEAGERRILSRDLTNADGDERKAAAVQAVRAVLAKAKG